MFLQVGRQVMSRVRELLMPNKELSLSGYFEEPRIIIRLKSHFKNSSNISGENMRMSSDTILPATWRAFFVNNSAICGLSIRQVSHHVSPPSMYSVSCRR